MRLSTAHIRPDARMRMAAAFVVFVAMQGCGGGPRDEKGVCTTLAENCSFDDMTKALRKRRSMPPYPNEVRAIGAWLEAAGAQGHVYEGRCSTTGECSKLCWVALQSIDAAALAAVARTKPMFEATAALVASWETWERSADCRAGLPCKPAPAPPPDGVAMTLRAGPMAPGSEHPEIFVELVGRKGSTCALPSRI